MKVGVLFSIFAVNLHVYFVLISVIDHKYGGSTVELGYKNNSLSETYILWYKLIPHKAHVFLGCFI